MTGPVDRDRQVEQLLRHSMSAGAPASSSCIEAERLAAWAEGGLRREDASAVERHVADCAHCQAMLAVFAESEPKVAAVSVWQRWSVRWLIPAAAASVAVFVWVLSTRGPADLPDASTTMARVEEDTLASPPSASPATVEPQQAMPAAPVQERSADQSATAARSTAPATESRETAARPAQAAVAPDTRADASRSSVAQGANTAPPAEVSIVTSPPMATVVMAPPAPRAESFDAAATGGVAALRADAGQILAPAEARVGTAAVVFGAPSTPVVRWRLLPDGRVERSLDSGRTWDQIALGGARVAAGSAPSVDVCWLVGSDGVVWRSTDGETFVRRPFPQAVALVAVVSQDAARATVTTADGRTFVTTDGGGSWRLEP